MILNKTKKEGKPSFLFEIDYEEFYHRVTNKKEAVMSPRLGPALPVGVTGFGTISKSRTLKTASSLPSLQAKQTRGETLFFV